MSVPPWCLEQMERFIVTSHGDITHTLIFDREHITLLATKEHKNQHFKLFQYKFQSLDASLHHFQPRRPLRLAWILVSLASTSLDRVGWIFEDCLENLCLTLLSWNWLQVQMDPSGFKDQKELESLWELHSKQNLPQEKGTCPAYQDGEMRMEWFCSSFSWLHLNSYY